MDFNETYWSTDAAFYFFKADNPERVIIQPKIATEVINAQPNKLLDYGCGDGYLVTLLPDDIQIDLFDKNKKILNETFIRLNKDNCNKIEAESKLLENTYDCIVLSFVLVCVDSKEEQERILKLLYKCLKTGGVLIVTNSHPCFLQYPNSSFHTSYKPKSYNYLNNGEPYVVNIHQSKNKPDSSFIDYKWTLSFWINLFFKVGFKLQNLKEIKDEKYEDLQMNNNHTPFLILKYKK